MIDVKHTPVASASDKETAVSADGEAQWEARGRRCLARGRERQEPDLSVGSGKGFAQISPKRGQHFLTAHVGVLISWRAGRAFSYRGLITDQSVIVAGRAREILLLGNIVAAVAKLGVPFVFSKGPRRVR